MLPFSHKHKHKTRTKDLSPGDLCIAADGNYLFMIISNVLDYENHRHVVNVCFLGTTNIQHFSISSDYLWRHITHE